MLYAHTTSRIAADLAAAADFTGTDYTDLIDEALVAGYIYELRGIVEVTPSDNAGGIIHRAADDNTFHYSIEVDGDDGSLALGGWTWAEYDADGYVVAEGGAPLTDAAELEDMIDTIAEWSDNAL